MLDKNTLNAKRAELEKVKAQLKTEFFGLDRIIDQVIDSMSAWYIFPQIITRPVIVNLWGMTGVGKTQLVRRIAALLNFSDRFVEVVMDGGSSHGYWASTISSILRESKIEEGTPGILLLDEIQRFRTVDQGQDVKVERYQDVWTLLSDGRFSADSSIFAEIDMMIAEHTYKPEKKKSSRPITMDELTALKNESTEPATAEPEAEPKGLSPWRANSLKKMLRLTLPIQEIMTWGPDDIMVALQQQTERESWEYDYTKLIIFISGNLDQAFYGANATGDADTDADYYHELTKNISLAQIKRALTQQFKPEQVARFGANHIIYPSMSRASYEALITATCKRYTDEMTAISGKTFTVGPTLLAAIYENSVYPTQGTRPVFSAIHTIFGTLLVNITFWMIENEIEHVHLMFSEGQVSAKADAANIVKSFPIELRLSNERAKITNDYKTLVSVHEAGHAVAYAMLTGAAPFEIRASMVQYAGGYVLDQTNTTYIATTAESMMHDLQIMLAGRAAEEIVFGKIASTTGASNDIFQATMIASNFVRQLGFAHTMAWINSGNVDRVAHVTEIDQTNARVTELVDDAYNKVRLLIDDNREFVLQVARCVLRDGVMNQDQFIEIAQPFKQLARERTTADFAAKFERFEKRVNESL